MMQLIVRASDISCHRSTAKIHKNTQNTAIFVRILIKYMSVQHIWNFSQLSVLFTFCKLENLSSNVVTDLCKQRPETPKLPGVDYVAKNCALAMMLKALPLVQFWSVLLLKEQMMTSVRKTLKTLVWSAQNRWIYHKVFPENKHKISLFWPIDFWPSLPRKFLWNRSIFPRICPCNSHKIWLFSRNLSEALHSMVRSSRFENIEDRSQYKFGGKLALFMRFCTFFMMKAK